MARKKNRRKEKKIASKNRRRGNLPLDARGTREEKPVIIIVCEGETEHNYFTELSSDITDKKTKITPELASDSDWKSILNKAEQVYIDEYTS